LPGLGCIDRSAAESSALSKHLLSEVSLDAVFAKPTSNFGENFEISFATYSAH
jgi:hypothetical protein